MVKKGLAGARNNYSGQHNQWWWLVIVLGIIITGQSCANIAAPSGGYRDSLPPRLISATPKDSTEKFNAQKITFTFDEYVELKEIQQNVLVSPLPKINPLIEYKLKTVTVKIKDTLEPNTTYSINFGNAIKDINENNALTNFTYVFSTGNTIDGYELTGKVIIAETGKTDSTMIAMLHRSKDDSAVSKERPRYVAKLDGKGNFLFRNLPGGTFSLYAVKDEGGAYRYLSPKQTFAFADVPVVIGADNTPVVLYAYLEKEELMSDKPKSRTPVKAPAAFNEKDKAKDQGKPLRFQTNLQNGQQDLLGDLRVEFATPLKVYDSTKFIFTDATFKPIPGAVFQRDTTNKIFTLQYKWIPNTSYKLIIEKGAAEESMGKLITKPDTISITTRKEEDYGSLKMRFRNLDLTKKPVLQFVQSDKVVFSYVFQGRPEMFIKLFQPGDYDLRMLYDENKNGKWDPGEFFGKHIQPEKVLDIPKKIKVRANWDNEVDIAL